MAANGTMVTVSIVVDVDPANVELLDRIQESGGSLSIVDVVRAEVESNLCSVSYVRNVEVKEGTTDAMQIKIHRNNKGTPVGLLADAEIHFDDGPLAGLKIVGFAIWERRNGNGHNVTFPARQYSINGERRSFAIVRPISDTAAQDTIRQLILDAYQAFEDQAQ